MTKTELNEKIQTAAKEVLGLVDSIELKTEGDDHCEAAKKFFAKALSECQEVVDEIEE